MKALSGNYQPERQCPVFDEESGTARKQINSRLN